MQAGGSGRDAVCVGRALAGARNPHGEMFCLLGAQHDATACCDTCVKRPTCAGVSLGCARAAHSSIKPALVDDVFAGANATVVCPTVP